MPANGVLVQWGVHTSNSGQPTMVAATLGSLAGPKVNINRWTGFRLAPDNQASVFNDRIPVVAGELLGMTVFNSTAGMCSGFTPGSDLVVYNGGPIAEPGSNFTPGSVIAQNRSPIWATIEADVDGDGYGDESQDKCPQSAAFQNPCPVLSISQQVSYAKGSIRLLGTASVDASLSAAAAIKLPKTKKSKARTVTLTAKPAAFTAGKLQTIKLRLPSSVKSALKQLKKGKSLSASVTLTGSGLANTATVTSKLKLKK